MIYEVFMVAHVRERERGGIVKSLDRRAPGEPRAGRQMETWY